MRKQFLYLYVFLTGAAVMSIEMSASRLIAPYFGTSLMVWANIIGIILLAMAAGYFFGGRIADKHPRASVLYWITLVAGLILTLVPSIAHIIFRSMTAGILATPVITIALAFVGILFVFAPPVFLLAMVSPFALRLGTLSTHDTGKTAGKLYALSTLGSLIGTFLPSFILIPTIGTRATLYLSAFILLTLAAIGLKRWFCFFIALLPLMLLFFAPHTVKASQNILWEMETPYQYIQVIRQKDQSLALVYNEGGGVQSISRPNHTLLSEDYYTYYLLLPFLRSQSNPQVWILGSAGGTMLDLYDYWVRPAIPSLALTGVEIDSDVIPLGQKFFGLTGQENIVNADARVFLNSQSEKADIIIVDAYSQQIYIPFHLSTQEFYRQTQTHLNTGGILAINVNAIDSSSRLLLSFEQTLSSVFAYTYVMPVPDSLNYVLLASDQPLDLTHTVSNLPDAMLPFWQYCQQKIKPAAGSGGILLSDDKAPVEFLTDQMIWQTIFRSGENNSDSVAISNSTATQSNTLIDSSATISPDISAVYPPIVNEKALEIFNLGHDLYMKRQFAEAIRLFDQALTIDPKCYQALNDKGAALAFQGQYDQGLTLIDQAMAIYPTYQHGHFNKGLALELASRWEESIVAYNKALEFDSGDVWSYYGIASIHGRQGKVELVLEYLGQAISLDPEVKEIARQEHDFVPVASDPRYQALIKP